MDKVDLSELKAKKNCLLAFRNKKVNSFENSVEFINAFAGIGYYFDKISYIAFNDSTEIVRALKDAKTNYENTVIICPEEMKDTLTGFIEHQYSAKFSEIGILKSGNSGVFILYSDAENRLLVSDIKQVLDNKYGINYEKSYIKTIGAPVKKINGAVLKAKSTCGDMEINISDSYGDCRIEIIYSDKTPKSAHDKVMRIFASELHGYIYAMDDLSIAEQLFRLLKLRRMKISVAESFTGGGVGQKLVEIPGISEVYFEGLNTYSNQAKVERLGVDQFTLQHFGAVSEQTAREMAMGLLNSGNCDIAISTTGIAGPKSDNTSKPVGLLYIAAGTRDNIEVYEYKLKGDRATVTNTAINLALFLAYNTIK